MKVDLTASFIADFSMAEKVEPRLTARLFLARNAAFDALIPLRVEVPLNGSAPWPGMKDRSSHSAADRPAAAWERIGPTFLIQPHLVYL